MTSDEGSSTNNDILVPVVNNNNEDPIMNNGGDGSTNNNGTSKNDIGSSTNLLLTTVDEEVPVILSSPTITTTLTTITKRPNPIQSNSRLMSMDHTSIDLDAMNALMSSSSGYSSATNSPRTSQVHVQHQQQPGSVQQQQQQQQQPAAAAAIQQQSKKASSAQHHNRMYSNDLLFDQPITHNSLYFHAVSTPPKKKKPEITYNHNPTNNKFTSIITTTNNNNNNNNNSTNHTMSSLMNLYVKQDDIPSSTTSTTATDNDTNDDDNNHNKNFHPLQLPTLPISSIQPSKLSFVSSSSSSSSYLLQPKRENNKKTTTTNENTTTNNSIVELTNGTANTNDSFATNHDKNESTMTRTRSSSYPSTTTSGGGGGGGGGGSDSCSACSSHQTNSTTTIPTTAAIIPNNNDIVTTTTTTTTVNNNNNTTTTTTSIKSKNSKTNNNNTNYDSPPIDIPSTRIPFTTFERQNRIRLGICAMDKKAKSKPMAEILSRLDDNLFYVIFFGDHIILNEPVDKWPVCDVVIAFYSKGYPLEKAKEYVALRKPLLLNDLDKQILLQDRRMVYDHLEASGIDVPRHVYLSRDDYVSTGTGDGNGSRDAEVLEFDDHIEVNGVVIHKPFVEKPVDAEDHNISIYYPTSAGGGCKKLFRKIGNRSSEFYPNINEVRRDGSYIYEEFVETQGTDVKMYSVGPEYGHAEARKSPAVDGKVERNQDGKEVRFPVILTFREKEIARRIVLVFKQFVCGFDILRVQEGHTGSVVSYVCDVNGWSFVKNSRKYYDDCAQILSEHIICSVKPAAHKSFSTLDPLVTTSLNRESGASLAMAARMIQSRNIANKNKQEKQRKIKLLTCGEGVSLLAGDDMGSTGASYTTTNSEAATLVEGALPVREFPSNLTSEPAPISKSSADCSNSTDDHQNKNKHYDTDNTSPLDGRSHHHHHPRRCDSFNGFHQEELRCVIAIVRHGDRTPKQKLKINMSEPHILRYFHDHSKDCKKELKVKSKAPLTEFLEIVKQTLSEMPRESSVDTVRYKLLHMRDILERWKIVGLNRKIQIKPRKFADIQDEETGETRCRCTEVQLVLKWGGNLTKLGERQSIQLGRRFRHAMYPDAPGGGILRLHSTFRHDLKIKTSDEGRVMKTAAAFAKGLLELEGDLPPILVSLVHKEKGSMHMLDPSGNKEVKMELDECKEKITDHLQKNIDVRNADEADLVDMVGPKEIRSLRRALLEVGNPREALVTIHKTMGELITQLDEMLGGMTSGEENCLRNNEHGEGIRGESEVDFALSGVKLYKGETLLELTERWRFIYDRLYDESTDKFDLSRIPDVHDNVRFDMLHNPHLGLTKTLQKLYEVAKAMADCVVPQEYGTTVAEKRSVGVKICHTLLEKVKYDLGVARSDNEVADIRYMINMEYAADLPINTMGRRVRTRLYFTSESHLHTVLNVLRFGYAGEDDNQYESPLLSEKGLEILNDTPELCYLTHVVFRVFEDSRSEMANDPRRFRIEILFSPGAHHTPLHMNELDRDHDASRFDTAPLQVIGREGLTCEDVEAFFEKAIMEGQEDEAASPSCGDMSHHNQVILPSSVTNTIPTNSNNKNAIITSNPSLGSLVSASD